FVKEELHIEENDRVARRNEAFHHNNDEFVTVDEMWARWFKSAEHNWTVDQIIDWLVYSVELPQYKDLFLRNEINGSVLPRIASPNTNYITAVLGISNPVHRQKLHLKALDLVLFGYRGVPMDYTKDVVLITLLIIALAAYWFAMYQRKTSQKKLSQLSSHLERLKDMESEFLGLQKKFEEVHTKQAIESPEQFDDVNTLREQLIEAEKELEMRLPRLQTLLRKTYDLELLHLNQEKRDNLKEMEEAREMVEKLRKRQAGLLNQIRSVHGSETESMDRRIYGLKQRMERTVREMEEHKQRWSQIELICGFPLTEEGLIKSAAVVSNELTVPNFASAVPFVAAHLPTMSASASFNCSVGSKQGKMVQIKDELRILVK
ncbi:unnamed protein product, partial [Soboliphyme baturini]|uniref:SAM domain-containing protein n=1 Tax=Soboliphyme baturini TaxID=241478 RepID=A0A183J1Z0_9BILA